MLEVPVNLRWDFNTSDNSLFFISVGTSSYLFTRQNCTYYYNSYNPRTLSSREITYTITSPVTYSHPSTSPPEPSSASATASPSCLAAMLKCPLAGSDSARLTSPASASPSASALRSRHQPQTIVAGGFRRAGAANRRRTFVANRRRRRFSVIDRTKPRRVIPISIVIDKDLLPRRDPPHRSAP